MEGSIVVQAYILVQTEVGRSAAVAGQITELPGVLSAEDVTGPYDVIVRTEAETMDDLGKLIVARIQVIEGITRTLTCPVVNLG
jgi:DNA-binding Lrp family transcriptional regulator